MLLIIVANALALNILFWLESRFTTLTGLPVLDTQNELTVVMLREQLPLYVESARSTYVTFAVFDFVFPLVGGVTIATLIAWLLTQNPAPAARRLESWSIALVPFMSTLFDWLENTALLSAVWLNAAAPTWLLTIAIATKRLKLAGLGFSAALLLVVLLFTLLMRLRAWHEGQSIDHRCSHDLSTARATSEKVEPPDDCHGHSQYAR